MKFLIFGNIDVKQDSLALKLLPKLQQELPEIEFKEFDPTENLAGEIEEGKLNIIDVVQGIDKMIVITDLAQIKQDRVNSLHDFDLGFNLKILEKIDKLKEVEIIGLPQDMKEEKALEEIKKILSN
jgi:allophanate hydrolase subunit 1